MYNDELTKEVERLKKVLEEVYEWTQKTPDCREPIEELVGKELGKL